MRTGSPQEVSVTRLMRDGDSVGYVGLASYEFLSIGTTPSCCNIPRSSLTARYSTALPLAKRHQCTWHYSSGSQRTSRRVFEHGANPFQRDARKPLHELGNLRTVLKVLEQRGNGHARAAEHPSSADPLGVPFNSGATRPINHETNRSIAAL